MRSLHFNLALAAVLIASSVQAGQKSNFFTAEKMNPVLIQNPQYQQMSPEERAKQETDWMKKDLVLSDKQAVQVDSINLKFAKMRSEMRGQMQGMDRDARMAKMQEMQTKKETELKSVLSEDQLKKYKELVMQRRQNRGQGMGRGNQ